MIDVQFQALSVVRVYLVGQDKQTYRENAEISCFDFDSKK